MFKLVDEARAWWPVTWPGVTEDGKVIENRIEMLFRLLDTDANVELEAEGAKVDQKLAELRVAIAGGDAVEAKPSEVCAEFLSRIAIDWRGVAAANGEPLPFGRENLARLLKVNGVFEACLRAYRACLHGRAEIRAGN